jgi:hypothetical protein
MTTSTAIAFFVFTHPLDEAFTINSVSVLKAQIIFFVIFTAFTFIELLKFIFIVVIQTFVFFRSAIFVFIPIYAPFVRFIEF